MPYTVPKLTDFSTAALDKAVRELLAALDQESAAVGSENDWKIFRDRWMARKNGMLTQINDLWLKAAPKEAKRDVGQRVNELKTQVEEAVDATLTRIQSGASSGKLAAERLDITLPGIRRPIGAEHPVIKTMNEMLGVFRNLGYSVEEGPEIETDLLQFRGAEFSAEPSRARYAGHPVHRRTGIEAAARPSAAAHAYFAGADSHHGKDEAAGARGVSGKSPPQRCAGCHPLADVSSGRRAGGRHQHHFLRSEGHARPRHESAVWIEREDALLSVVLSLYRAQRRHADQLHFLRRQRHARRRSLPQLQGQRMD